ncbi:hypothetical protein QBC40DRAFT_166491 [Triangularia verruculosa]|uniref:Uncharacterized protein n=1 Tax=Triangularia verruculosa TaxID=2587418 RepID=A0AAN6XSI8_9PEZI|nr:hypothetical protein QBC40DRAFT_166491 [Triangularia verruculosa]
MLPFLPFLFGLAVALPQAVQPREDTDKVLCFELGLKPAFANWALDCQSVINTLQSQYTTNRTFNSPKDYIWIMNEKCSALIYQSALNNSIPIPDVPMPIVAQWAKDYIFDQCIIAKNNSGAFWGVGENKTFPFNGLKTVFLPSSVAVSTWWQIMGWPSHSKQDSLNTASLLYNNSESLPRIQSRSESAPTAQCFNATELGSELAPLLDIIGHSGNIFATPTTPIVQNDCQAAINLLRGTFDDIVLTFQNSTSSHRYLYNSCVAVVWNTSPTITVPNVNMTTVVQYAQDRIFNDCVANDLSGIWYGVGEDTGSSLRMVVMPESQLEAMLRLMDIIESIPFISNELQDILQCLS